VSLCARVCACVWCVFVCGVTTRVRACMCARVCGGCAAFDSVCLCGECRPVVSHLFGDVADVYGSRLWWIRSAQLVRLKLRIRAALDLFPIVVSFAGPSKRVSKRQFSLCEPTLIVGCCFPCLSLSRLWSFWIAHVFCGVHTMSKVLTAYHHGVSSEDRGLFAASRSLTLVKASRLT
jgi:hypothetical protein